MLFPGLKTVGKFLKNPVGAINRDVKKVIKKPSTPFKSVDKGVRTVGKGAIGSIFGRRAAARPSSTNTGIAGTASDEAM